MWHASGTRFIRIFKDEKAALKKKKNAIKAHRRLSWKIFTQEHLSLSSTSHKLITISRMARNTLQRFIRVVFTPEHFAFYAYLYLFFSFEKRASSKQVHTYIHRHTLREYQTVRCDAKAKRKISRVIRLSFSSFRAQAAVL